MSSVYEDSLIAVAAYPGPDGDAAREKLQEMGWTHVGDHRDIFDSSPDLEDNSEIINQATESGYHAEVFISSEGQMVVGNRGTEFGSPFNEDSWRDYVTDAQLFVAIETQQEEVAVELLNAISEQYSVNSIHVTGHSLGGYLSQNQDNAQHDDESGLTENSRNNVEISGTAFDAPGIGSVDDDDATDNHFLRVNDQGDFINIFGFEHVGLELTVDSPVSKRAWRG